MLFLQLEAGHATSHLTSSATLKYWLGFEPVAGCFYNVSVGP